MYMAAVLIVLAAVITATTSTSHRQSLHGAHRVLFGDLPAELFFVTGEVESGNYTYYVITGSGYVTILLDSLVGDADLYVSSKRKEPRFALDTHEFHSTTCGIDRVDIGKSVPRPLYVGVYGHPSKELTRHSKYRLIALAIQPPQDEKAEYFQPPEVPDELIEEFEVDDDDDEKPHNVGDLLLKLLRFLFELAIEILL